MLSRKKPSTNNYTNKDWGSKVYLDEILFILAGAVHLFMVYTTSYDLYKFP